MSRCGKCRLPGHNRQTCRFVIGDDGYEQLCDHGVGHGDVHTCDGCCVTPQEDKEK